MAHIVPFRSGAAREASEPEPRPRRGAEIVIFPGVRRERHADPEPAHVRQARPVRDILVLPD